MRLSEAWAKSEQASPVLAQVIELAGDSDAQVRLQVACSLGYWENAPAAEALARLVLAHPHDRFLRAAVISSLTHMPVAAFIDTLLKNPASELELVAPSLLPMLCRMLPEEESEAALLRRLATGTWPGAENGWTLRVLAQLLDNVDLHSQLAGWPAKSSAGNDLRALIEQARQTLADDSNDRPESYRIAAIGMLNRSNFCTPAELEADRRLLSQFLLPRHSVKIQAAALEGLLGSLRSDGVQAVLAAWPELSPTLRTSAIDRLLARPAWAEALLDSLEKQQLAVVEIDAARRQQLLSSSSWGIRTRAEKLFAGKVNQDREAVLKSYAAAVDLTGDAARGAELYRKNCSSCHKLKEMGAAVGPDLVALAGKPVSFFLQEILDPNRNLDSRYMAYTALTEDGRTLTGLLVTETASAILLRAADGKEETLQRAELEQFRATRASLMPEGLEKMLDQQAMADVICFIKANATEQAAPESMASGELARDMLNDTLSMERRLALVPLSLKTAPEVITAMAANLPNDEKEEYRRIPWIWRVAVAAGKAGDEPTLKKVIEVSLPRDGAQLRDWQAVVIGGGVINGLGLRGDWPAARIAPMLAADARLNEKWQAVIVAAKAMAENDKVRTGTRYDALRIVALEAWPAPKEQLLKYLPKGGNSEMQMGAVSGLADIDDPEATQLLVEHFDHFDKENRRLAVVALSRGPVRQRILLDLVKAGKIQASEVAESERKLLLKSTDSNIAKSASELFK